MELTALWAFAAVMLPVMLVVGCMCFDDDPTEAEMESLLASRGPSFARQHGQFPSPGADTALSAMSANDFPLFHNRGLSP